MRDIYTIMFKVKEVVNGKYITDMDIDYNDDLKEKGIDSVKIIELIMDIEEIFNFEFKPSDLIYNNLKNIKVISEYILNNSNENKV